MPHGDDQVHLHDLHEDVVAPQEDVQLLDLL